MFNPRSPKKRGERRRNSTVNSSQYYKRGSTLASGDISSALKKRQQSQIEAKNELRHKDVISKRKRMLRYALLILILGWFISRQFIAGAVVVKPDGIVDSQYTELEALAQEYVESQKLSLFKPLFNEAAAESYLQSKIPLLGAVEVTAPLFSRTIRINPEFRSPAFVWNDERHNSKYIIDKEGVVISKVNNNSSPKDLITISDKSGLEPEVTKPLLPPSVAEFLTDFTNTLHTDTELRVQSYNATSSVKDFQVALKPPQKFSLKVTTLRGAKEQVGDLKPVLEFLQDKNTTPSQYIDIRLSDRVFYK